MIAKPIRAAGCGGQTIQYVNGCHASIQALPSMKPTLRAPSSKSGKPPTFSTMATVTNETPRKMRSFLTVGVSRGNWKRTLSWM
ncbi:MAG TPA: hypothetical protein DEF51_29825 [Myxococcales bacterium]|nr:hypothetical protein [Myxococcales bacterium]